MRTIDLFAGCGGLALGFQNAGYKLVGAVDNWQPAIKTYKANFPDHEIFDIDLTNVKKSSDTLSKLAPDIIIGGPPCQDFSHAGKRDESLGRADLTISFAKIIAKVQPKWFVMENVDQISRFTKLGLVRSIFKNAGYGITEKVLDASLCGVPQKRKRFFMIGEQGGEDNALEYYLIKNLSSKPMTVRDYFGNSLDVECYYRHPRNYSRRAIFSVDEPSPTIRGVNRPIPKGYPGHSLDANKDLKKCRPLTTIERSYVQTFPKNFILEGSKTNLEQLIGNAVPVNLGKYVAECINEYLNNSLKSPSVAKQQQNLVFPISETAGELRK